MRAVATVGEGTQLRQAGITVPILVLGAVTAEDVEEGVESRLTQTVCSPRMVQLCENAGRKADLTCDVHMKADTGMGRIGVRTDDEKEQLLRELAACRHVRLTGAYTHFSDADGDEAGMGFTRSQFQRFLELTSGLPGKVIRHCCNSAAIHRFPEMSLDMVRAGISLYGYPPVPDVSGLKPCMAWTASISHIKDIPPDTYVSYSRTFRSGKVMRLATVTCGYGDGYFRSAGPRGYVLIRGRKAKIVGRICMDQMMADITGLDDVQPGDEAVLMGKSGSESITADDLADWAGTISYEVLLRSGGRVERIYTNDAGTGGNELP